MFNVLVWKKDEVLMTGVIFCLIVLTSYFQLRNGQMKTRDAQRKADVELVGRALQAIKEDHQYLPEATESGKIKSCGRHGQEVCEWGVSKVVDGQNIVYMQKLPQDPFAFKGWKYIYDGKRIYVALENKKDKGIRKNLTIECGNGVQCNWYVEI